MASNEINDAVNHPSHYTNGLIEVISYIRDKLTPEEYTGYCLGNVMKYVSRWRYKDGIQDLEKAQVYLNWAIEGAKRESYIKGYDDDVKDGLCKGRVDSKNPLATPTWASEN